MTDFFNWYHQTATADEKELWGKMYDYAELYFEDMNFNPDSLCSGFCTAQYEDDQGNWVDFQEDTGLDYLGDQFTVAIKNLRSCEGRYDPRKNIISIGKKHKDNKAVIVHEMIHYYEDRLIKHNFHDLRDILVFCLYGKLKYEISDLDERIKTNAHVILSDKVEAAGGYHSILFNLKSLDLDLSLGLKLGTVFGYQFIMDDTGEEV